MSVIYEVTLCVDREIVDDFDQWLAAHIAEMLELPGFTDAEAFKFDDEAGRPCRVVNYELENQAALDEYLAEHAAEMRQSGIDQFGEQFSASRRILTPSDISSTPTEDIQSCLNCGAALGGQYCGNCGQRARSRMISIWELTRDAFGDLFELDSRLWRSLIPLLVRPGKLTKDYLEGRRARYMPPFRTYLVLSIVFFLVAFFDPQKELPLFFEAPVPAAEEQLDGDAQAVDEAKEELLAELEEKGILADHPELADRIQEEIDQHNEADGPGLNIQLGTEEDPEQGVTLSFDDEDDGGICETGDLEDQELPQWLKNRLTPERIKAMCDKIKADEGETLLAKLLENIPAGLILLLPLMAIVLKMLYPLSKRYYVEHLLFFVHFHAFFFLILTLMIIFERDLGPAVSLPEPLTAFVIFVSSLYIPIYLYKAMRRVYGQGHLWTIPKYFVLALAYFMGFTLMIVFALLLAAFSI